MKKVLFLICAVATLAMVSCVGKKAKTTEVEAVETPAVEAVEVAPVVEEVAAETVVVEEAPAVVAE